MTNAKQQRQDQREREERQREHSMQMQGLQRSGGQEDAGKVLRYISELDDVPIDADDPVLGSLVSKVISTSNLSAEQIRSNEWVIEYLLILYLSRRPRQDGMHGTFRAWAADDEAADLDPIGPAERLEIETAGVVSGMAMSRSEDFTAVKEGARDISESIVDNEQNGGNSGGGGLLGRLRG